jgi:hypothetical protein
MIKRQEYVDAVRRRDAAQEIIDAYQQQNSEAAKEIIASGKVFQDEELTYSATSYCPCGHGLAYPTGCGKDHHWDCSAVLKGEADLTDLHTARLPFRTFKIRGENLVDGSTRGKVREDV